MGFIKISKFVKSIYFQAFWVPQNLFCLFNENTRLSYESLSWYWETNACKINACCAVDALQYNYLINLYAEFNYQWWLHLWVSRSCLCIYTTRIQIHSATIFDIFKYEYQVKLLYDEREKKLAMCFVCVLLAFIFHFWQHLHGWVARERQAKKIA